jgi:hypothetical protein
LKKNFGVPYSIQNTDQEASFGDYKYEFHNITRVQDGRKWERE